MIGFILGDGTYAIPDKSVALSVKPTIVTARFGDGYENRARKGLNSLEGSYSVSFSNRKVEEADEIASFFDTVLGVQSFPFTLPVKSSTSSATTTFLVVCEDYNRTLDYNNYHSITATFRRVYDVQ